MVYHSQVWKAALAAAQHGTEIGKTVNADILDILNSKLPRTPVISGFYYCRRTMKLIMTCKIRIVKPELELCVRVNIGVNPFASDNIDTAEINMTDYNNYFGYGTTVHLNDIYEMLIAIGTSLEKLYAAHADPDTVLSEFHGVLKQFDLNK